MIDTTRFDTAKCIAQNISAAIPPKKSAANALFFGGTASTPAVQAANATYKAAAIGAWKQVCIEALTLEQQKDSQASCVYWPTSLRCIMQSDDWKDLALMAESVPTWADYDIKS